MQTNELSSREIENTKWQSGGRAVSSGRAISPRSAIRSVRALIRSAVDPSFDARFWPQNTYLVNHEHRFIYCPVPKVACTTLKELIVDLGPERLRKGPGLHGRVHRRYSLSNYRRGAARRILGDPGYFRFAFVRNPWDRLVSAYYSKFVRPQRLAAFASRVVEDVYRHQALKPDFARSITFREFTDHVCRTEDGHLDEHWKPQHLFLGNVRFDLVGRMETLAEDFESVRNALSLPELALSRSNSTPYSPPQGSLASDLADMPASEVRQLGAFPDFKAFYTGDLVSKVEQRYLLDIERFGYEFN